MNCNCTDWNVDVIYYLRASKVMCKLTDQWLNFSMEIMHFQAYGSPRQYSHFMWVLKLLTSHKYHCSHPVQIQGSNHTHFLTSFWLQLHSHGCWPIATSTDREKSFTARNGDTTCPENCFLKPFVQKGGEKWPTKCQQWAFQGHLVLNFGLNLIVSFYMDKKLGLSRPCVYHV